MTTDNSSQESATQGASSDSGASQDSSSSQSTNTSQQPAAASQTANPIAPATPAAPTLDANGNPVIAAPAYQPNYKFKAFGKEHEIEETFRSLIKDKETEEKIRKFHEKAYAMEQFQNDNKKVKTEFDTFKATVTPDLKAMGHFNNLLKNKDWDNFFGGLKIPDEEIFNWVEKRLQLRAMPADQRAEFERQAQIRQQNYAYENELSQQQETMQELQTQTRLMQFENVMARQDVAAQAEAIDKVYGEIGAFRRLVVEEGINHYNRTGGKEDLSADQAVQMTLQKYGRFLQTQNQGVVAPQGTMNQGAAPQGTSPGQAPIIPHVGGSARSPVKKSPRTLDDLKKMAKDLQT